MQFLRNFGKIICWHPPTSEKSWIRHWLVFWMKIYVTNPISSVLFSPVTLTVYRMEIDKTRWSCSCNFLRFGGHKIWDVVFGGWYCQINVMVVATKQFGEWQRISVLSGKKNWGEVLFFLDGMAKNVGGWHGKICWRVEWQNTSGVGWSNIFGVACQNILDDGRQKNVAKLFRGVWHGPKCTDMMAKIWGLLRY